MEKTFDPAQVEGRIYAAWEASGAFEPKGDGRKTYSIVLPPPNVTGSLHIGHALNHTLQDVLVRFHRMRDFDVLWQPGVDHAGIATQSVVERQLAEAQAPGRREMGREAFVDKVWAWKEESGGMILEQDRRLGMSCAWSREAFTMGERGAPDDQMVAAVMKVFVQLYQEGLIYRDKRLVNWDPKLQTAISDLEVETIEVKGHFWHFKYPLADGATYRHPIAFDEAGAATEWEERDFISIATTRPETMLGDGAVAVHPDDQRYASLVGKEVILPLAERAIPIIADAYPDPEKGSGAVKITGAHDFNDYAVAQRHSLELFDLMDEQARLHDRAYIPAPYRGLDRYEARKAIVADMEARGLLEKVEDRLIQQPFGDRSGVVIEPLRTDQWYVDAETLAKPAIEAVRSGKTRFVPDSWAKTYFRWMENIQPWCISRQLWWGHRIPAWYGPDGTVFVALNEAEAAAKAASHYGEARPLVQDEDVLDTWFSSALWPFSTLGWPEETPELKAYYPTSVLVSGHDIIFFWVARMMMQGLHFMGEAPFKEVYMHALVRDEKGQKMSKSKGNVIDPLDLVDAYGADAVRFTLMALAAQGRDIRISADRVEGYRNFGTKIWNAARFAKMNGCAPVDGWSPEAATLMVNRWIVGEVAATAQAVTEALETYRFNEAAGAIYKFAWNTYCDWYLELIKPVLSGPDGADKSETQACAAWALDELLKLLHPFSPFISEALWEATAGDAGRAHLLISAAWPAPPADYEDAAARSEIGWLVEAITNIRSVRADMNVPAAAKAQLVLVGASETVAARVARHEEALVRLARLSGWTQAPTAPGGAVQVVAGDATLALPLGDLIDLDAEKARLAKEIAKLDGEIGRLVKKLSNARFVANAPEDLVAAERDKQAGYESQKAKLAAALAQVGG